MYCIIVYDISGDKVVKVCHYLRRYLNWVQNSVFEGELTKSQYREVEHRLNGFLDLEQDSVIIYRMRTDKSFKRKQMGSEKRPSSRII